MTALPDVPPDVPAHAPRRAHVLLVEDNEVNAYLARFLLERAGYTVTAAGNGEQALAAAALRKPDLVLMDMRMPVMDGLEATRRFKADPALAAVPVLALSANVLPQEKQQASAAGCAGHIEKPIDVARFVALVQQLLPPELR
jgi:CheY-like chemotaxis protein